MLKYTGHPLMDVGVATVAALSGKGRPEDLVEDDLDQVGEYLLTQYMSGVLTPYLSCVFTMNAAYTQPSWDKDRRRREAREVLFAHRQQPDAAVAGLRCAFSGEPATRLVHRQHVPMLTGENVLNFFPAGIGGLPISGPYLVAMQAFPLGARRCYGRALAVHCPDDYELTFAFARRFLADNRRLLLLAEQSRDKYLDAKAPKTLVISVLLAIEAERLERSEETPPPSVTIYHLSNSGRGPDIDVYHLPSESVRFIRMVSRAGVNRTWHEVERAAWERAAPASQDKRTRERKKGARNAARPEEPAAWGPGITRNYLYEDLFDLPANVARFVRTYFLRRAYRSARQADPRREYRLSRDLDVVSWELTRLLLTEVIGMEKTRIEAIRTLGDRIAEHIALENDRRLFGGFYRADRYGTLRNLLIKVSSARLKRGRPPLVGFEEFLLIFEDGEEVARVDWTLARDLVLIRVIEELYRQGWFGSQPEALEELEPDEASESVASA